MNRNDIHFRIVSLRRVVVHLTVNHTDGRVNVTALKIHMSDSAHGAIMEFPEFITEPRGAISVKVKNKCYSINKRYYLKNNV